MFISLDLLTSSSRTEITLLEEKVLLRKELVGRCMVMDLE